MKKQRLIYTLIISVVILSLLFVSSVPVSAAESDSSGTVVYKGEELLAFLHLYTIDLYAADNFDMSDAELVDPSLYQVVLDYSGDNVYLYLTSMGAIRGRYFSFIFKSRLYASVLPRFSYFNTTVYKRYSSDNGDDGTPDYPASFSVVLETTEYASGYYYEKEVVFDPVEGVEIVPVDYPFLNNVVIDGRTYLDPNNPFLSNDPESVHYNRYISSLSAPLEVTYNPYDEFGIPYDGLSHFWITYDSGFSYYSGAVAFCITPITINIINPEWFEEWGWLKTMSPSDLDQYLDSLTKAENADSILDNFSSTLGGYSEFVSTGTHRPTFDMAYILDLDNIGLLNDGMRDFNWGVIPLFRESSFFNVFLILAAPPLIVSYLLFGKKG